MLYSYKKGEEGKGRRGITGQAFIQRKLVVLIQEEITKERKREFRSYAS
jgi:hypothetical protein